MSWTIDASIACKWFVEEEGSAEAEKLLVGGETLLAPDLIIPEVCSALWKKLRAGHMTRPQAIDAMDGLPAFFDDLVPCQRLGARSLAIARELDYSVYDCFYLALGELNDVKLVTADVHLLARLAGTPWAGRAVGLGGFDDGE